MSTELENFFRWVSLLKYPPKELSKKKREKQDSN